MTYEKMEFTLIEKIADLRMSESDFMRSMARIRNGETGIDVSEKYVRMNAHLDEVEKLLARMESFETVAQLAGAAAPMTTTRLAA